MPHALYQPNPSANTGISAFYARSYGARADGVTDDTVALVAALTAANNAGGGTVYLMDGTSIFSGVLPIGSNVGIKGSGMGRSILKFATGAAATLPNPATTSANGLIAANDPWYNVNQYFADFTLDFNGYGNTVVSGAGLHTLFTPGSRSLIERVELVNRAGYQSFWINISGHDTTVRDCWVHDDIVFQSNTTGALAAGSAVVMGVTSSGGYATPGVVPQQVLIDPVVASIATVPATGVQTVTPHAIHENTNVDSVSGISTGMLGIYVGQVLTIDSGTQQENVTVTARTVSTFTANFTKTHTGPVLALYLGNPEVCQVSAVAGLNITLTAVQAAHASGVAVVVQPACGDGVACTSSAVGQSLAAGQENKGSRIIGNRFERLASDGAGAQQCSDVVMSQNNIFSCGVGLISINCDNSSINDNTMDFSAYGIYPTGQLFAGVLVWSNVAASVRGLSIYGNNIIGNVVGIDITVQNGAIINDVTIQGNTIEQSGANGINVLNAQSVSITTNVIRNPNQSNLLTNPAVGGDIAAILINGAGGGVAGNILIADNIMIDNRGTHQMRCGVFMTGANAFLNTIRANQISGLLAGHVGIQSSAGATYVARDNQGYNPLAGLAVTPAVPATTIHQQNLTGVDVQVSVLGGTVTAVIVYDVNNLNPVTVATATPALGITVPATAWISLTYTVAPTWAWYGL